MTFLEFLKKETPNNGCMLCLAKYKINYYDCVENKYMDRVKEEYMLVEKHKIANGDMYIINKRPHYDYDFAWCEDMPWEILYKKEL